MKLFKFLKPSSFAPAERESDETIAIQANNLADESLRWGTLNMVPDLSIIINDKRQVIFANKSLLDFLKIDDPSSVLGLRPGEILDCVHADNDSGGCGTTEFCSMCGAVNAILNAQNSHLEDTRECEISTSNGNAYNLKIWTYPFKFNNDDFVLCSIRDIADEKYRQALEHIFFHDLINIGSGLCWLVDVIGNDSQKLPKYHDTLHKLSHEIVDEIEAQRDLLDAERGIMPIRPESISTIEIISSCVEMYSSHRVAEDRKISIDPASVDSVFISDQRLLKRVIGNMLKNALEAVSAGDSVSIRAIDTGEFIRFEVSNPGVIPREGQLQIFNRAYSTKGRGRGLGTYSIKLLTENYLRGKAGFNSDSRNGTTFFIELPPELKAADSKTANT